MLRIGEVIAARRINKDEARLENLPTADMPDGWEESREIKGLLGEPPTPYAWHDRMAAECEARRNLAAAIWHLDRMAREPKDPIAT